MRRPIARIIVGGVALVAGLAVGALEAPGVEATEATASSRYGGPLVVVTAIKTVSGDFVEGGHITYTITLRNHGTVDSLDNPGHEFEDDICGGVFEGGEAMADNGVAEWFEAPTITPLVFWDGSIPAGGTVTITINAVIAHASMYNCGSYPRGVIPNQGRVHVDSNADGINDTIVYTDDVAGLPIEETIFTFPVGATSTTIAPDTNASDTTGTTAAVSADTLPQTGTRSTGAQTAIAVGLILIGSLLLAGTRIHRANR